MTSKTEPSSKISLIGRPPSLSASIEAIDFPIAVSIVSTTCRVRNESNLAIAYLKRSRAGGERHQRRGPIAFLSTVQR